VFVFGYKDTVFKNVFCPKTVVLFEKKLPFR